MVRSGGSAWALFDRAAGPRAFGGLVAWALRQGVDRLDVVVDAGRADHLDGLLAWRAEVWSLPIRVWSLRGRDLGPALGRPPDPEPAVAEGAWSVMQPASLLGLDVVAEHGVLRAEVLGLEVARALPGADGSWRLAVGVGAHDRNAMGELHPGEDPLVSLERAADAVASRRRPGQPLHPANTLARERWLRCALVSAPALVGATELRAVSPPARPGDLREPCPAPALGADSSGPVVVVASVGADLDLVGAAADCRRLRAPDARLVLALPAVDDRPLTRALAAALRDPASVVAVDPGWEDVGGRGAAPR